MVWSMALSVGAWSLGLELALRLGAGCSCQPTLPPPPPNDDQQPDPTGATGVTGDTGPPPPCASPELEPNNSLTEFDALAMEQHGCGLVDAPLDIDYWEFTVDDDGWLEVIARADFGSPADLTFVLAPRVGTWAASRPDGVGTVDSSIVFLAPAGTYTMAVSEQNLGGGPRYAYDLLATEAKPPVEWTRTEVEPNDSDPAAEIVQPGDVIYGTMSGNGALPDYDWYAITIPSGRHTLTIDVDAYDVGSSANLTVNLWDTDLELACPTCSLLGGIPGVELDPIGSYDATQAQVIYIQVLESVNLEGPANWYTLAIGLEDG